MAIGLDLSMPVLMFGLLASRRGRGQSRLSSVALSDHGDDAEDPIVITTSSSEGSEMSEMSDAETDPKAEEAGVKGKKGAGASQGREPGSTEEGADGVRGPGEGVWGQGGQEGRKGGAADGEDEEEETEAEGNGRGGPAGPPQKKVKILEPAKGVRQKKKIVSRWDQVRDLSSAQITSPECRPMPRPLLAEDGG